MAETDGTPSAPKPVDGESPPSSATATSVPVSPVVTVVRPSDPSSTEEATRAALRKTLQAGVGAAQANAPAQDRAAGELLEQARRVAALADTQQDLPRTPGMTAPPRASRNPKLARTLRMDLKLPPSQEDAGAADAAPTSSAPPVGAARTLSPRPHMPTQHGMPLPQVQPPPNEHTGSRPAYGAPPIQAQAHVQPSGAAPHMDPHSSTRVGYDDGSRGSVSVHGAAPNMRRSSMPPAPRKRPLRPGERTMILSKRRNGKKDWLFVVLVVGALGVTASMLLAYQNQSTSDGSETSEEAVPEEEAAEQEPEAPAEDTAQQAASAEPAQPASSSVRATELRSDPVGAEVVVNGAVVGNTPVRVARSDADVDYTLRLPGYESKVVRVGAQSPGAISVTLRPNTQ